MGAIYRGNSTRTRRGENDFSGGVNTGFSVFDLKVGESIDEHGWDTDMFPAKVSAKGRTPLGDMGMDETRLMCNYGQERLIRAVGPSLQYYDDEWIDIGSAAPLDWDWTNFNDQLFIVNGANRFKYSGSTLEPFATETQKGAKYITNDSIRLWLAIEDVLHFSGYLDENDWTSAENSGFIQYYTPNGGDITALTEFYGDKWVFKKDSMAVIKGTNYHNFSLVSVSNDIGCVNFKTIKEVGDTLFWLGENDVYAHQGGKPSPIGHRIRKYLDSINRDHVDKCCAITDGLRYYLCLVTGDSTEPNIRLVYDPRYDVWQVSVLDENYRYSCQLNNVTYAGDNLGQTWIVNKGVSEESWSVEMGLFDEGQAEVDKQYKEIHLQGYFPVGTTLKLEVSVSDKGDDWIEIEYYPFASNVSQSSNAIIPLDMVPLCKWARFRLSGRGYVEIQKMQRYYKVYRR